MASADALERQLLLKRQAAAKAAAAAKALSNIGGTADARERAAVAAREGISQSQAAKRINAQVNAARAAQGIRTGTATSADRAEEQQVAAIYGTSTGNARKIINTQVDAIRASQGLPPISAASEKVSQIPAPLVASSGAGSLMAGYQPTGPVSSTTGRPLVENLPARDASADLRQQPATSRQPAGGATSGGATGGGGTVGRAPDTGAVGGGMGGVGGGSYDPAMMGYYAQDAALGAMTDATGATSGTERLGLRLRPSSRGRAEVKSTSPFMRRSSISSKPSSLFATSNSRFLRGY